MNLTQTLKDNKQQFQCLRIFLAMYQGARFPKSQTTDLKWTSFQIRTIIRQKNES